VCESKPNSAGTMSRALAVSAVAVVIATLSGCDSDDKKCQTLLAKDPVVCDPDFCTTCADPMNKDNTKAENKTFTAQHKACDEGTDKDTTCAAVKASEIAQEKECKTLLDKGGKICDADLATACKSKPRWSVWSTTEANTYDTIFAACADVSCNTFLEKNKDAKDCVAGFVTTCASKPKTPVPSAEQDTAYEAIEKACADVSCNKFLDDNKGAAGCVAHFATTCAREPTTPVPNAEEQITYDAVVKACTAADVSCNKFLDDNNGATDCVTDFVKTCAREPTTPVPNAAEKITYDAIVKACTTPAESSIVV